jgi:hypothetical protein
MSRAKEEQISEIFKNMERAQLEELVFEYSKAHEMVCEIAGLTTPEGAHKHSSHGATHGEHAHGAKEAAHEEHPHASDEQMREKIRSRSTEDLIRILTAVARISFVTKQT